MDEAVERSADREATLRVLRDGELELVGRLVSASNITLYCRLTLTDGAGRHETAAVYKPIRGEAPLYDFPDGTLAHREVAAFAVSEATGWGIVPPTVLRDGPFGLGMVQAWVEADDSVDVVELIRRDDPCLRRMAVFDAVVNNADRKAGHVLPMPDGHIHGVDHGVCFSAEPKLRTVLWGWRGQPLEAGELEILGRLRRGLDGGLGAELRKLLTFREVAATARRLDRLLARPAFPLPDPGRPAIPWPWY